MEHSEALVRLAVVAVAAAVSGLGFLYLRQPVLVGFMLAGVVLGPTGIGLISGNAEVALFAELGVLLLLFVVGLEISLRSLKRVLRVVFLCALAQAAVAVSVTLLLGWLLSWPLPRSVLIGFVLSLSSTAVGVKLLEQLGAARTELGRVTVGVLVAQDLLMIPMLIIVASLGGEGTLGVDSLVDIVIAIAGLAVLIWGLSRRDKIRLPFSDAVSRSSDAGPLAALAFCLAFAAAATLLGVPASYGAFVAGLILGASTLRRATLRVSVPIQSLLMMVFFLSIGLMVDVPFILSKAGVVFGLLVLVLPLKTLVNLVVLRGLGVAPREAIVASMTMAQLGEFGFVLTAAGVGVGAISSEGYQIALSVIALSLAASPLWALTSRRIVNLPAANHGAVTALLAEAFRGELAWLHRLRDRLRRNKSAS